MMREFKFRSFGKDGMLYSSLDEDLKVQNMVTVFRNGNLMQYTGIKDKKSKDIYEGDIIKIFGGRPLEIFWVSEGYWSWYEAGLHLGEIIGNIYENQELLKGIK